MAIIDIQGKPHAYDFVSSPSQSSRPVLVFIHGWLLSRQYWLPLINYLSPHYPCLIYDLRGFGDSQGEENAEILSSKLLKEATPSSASAYTLAAYAQDLKILLEKLNIEKAWLIGHSLGGSIAIWGADFCCDRVLGAICLNSGGGIYIKEEFERFRKAGTQLVKRRPRWLYSLPGMNWIFARTMVARPLSREWGKQRIIDFLRADGKAALGALLDSTTEEEVNLLPQMVSRLSQPVYFVAGAADKVMETKYVCHLASFHSLFCNCAENVIEIPECGHMSMVEKPEAVATAIQDILSKH